MVGRLRRRRIHCAAVSVDGDEFVNEVLDGSPIIIAELRPELPNPLAYDLTSMRPRLSPLPLVPPATPRIPAEPSDGSVVRFTRGGAHYTFIAVRRGNQWETTATSDVGLIHQVMCWEDMASRTRKFDIAATWDEITQHTDIRVRQHLAVVGFSIDREYWYTTITEAAEERLPFGNNAFWTDIARHGKHIHIATSWAPLY